MSTVRRCDNPRCDKGGKKGVPAISDVANPAGWLTGNVTASASDLVVGNTVGGDFCTVDCAAQALLIHHRSAKVVSADRIADPPDEPAAEPPKAAR